MPKVVAMIITSLQLLQMVVGCAVNYFAFKFKESGEFLKMYFSPSRENSTDLHSGCQTFPDHKSLPKETSNQIYKLYVQEDNVQSPTTISSTVPSCTSVTSSSLPGLSLRIIKLGGQ